MATPALLLFVVVVVVVVAMVVSSTEAKLTPEFYHRTCPQIHHIVRTEVVKAVAAEPRIAASLVRLHFHDCFVHVSHDSYVFCAHWLSVTMFY